MFAPVQRLPNDVLLRIFHISYSSARITACQCLTSPWLLCTSGIIEELSRSSTYLWTTIILRLNSLLTTSTSTLPPRVFATSYWKIPLLFISGGPRYTPTCTDPPRPSSLLHPFSAPARPLRIYALVGQAHAYIFRKISSDLLLQDVTFFGYNNQCRALASVPFSQLIILEDANPDFYTCVKGWCIDRLRPTCIRGASCNLPRHPTHSSFTSSRITISGR